MYRRSPEELSFSPEHEQVLQDLTIDESGPGTVLHDFNAFLTFIKEQELPVTPMRQLRRRVLPAGGCSSAASHVSCAISAALCSSATRLRARE